MERDERLFVDGIGTRAEHLIGRHIWQGIDLARCRNWISQFRLRDCELLGACLLDSFIYRSKPQVEALLRSVLTSPAMLGRTAANDSSLIESLRGGRDPGIRICPVIRLDQSPTKSGTYVLRLLARSLGLQEKWMRWPQALIDEPTTIHTVVVVDDFCGSGKQFTDFVTLAALDTFIAARPRCRIVYVTAAAHVDGISKVAADHPSIDVLSGEVLGADAHFFEGTALKRIKADGVVERLRDQYDRIATEVGLGGSRVGPLGFSDQALTYAFAHRTPNNTLPIYWKATDLWSPLVDR